MSNALEAKAIPEDVMQAAEACYAECEQMDSYGIVETIARAILAERERSQWQPIDTAPTDGTIVNVVGRYADATAGFPRYAGYRDGQWFQYSRFEPQVLVCWAWRPRDEWPREGRI